MCERLDDHDTLDNFNETLMCNRCGAESKHGAIYHHCQPPRHHFRLDPGNRCNKSWYEQSASQVGEGTGYDQSPSDVFPRMVCEADEYQQNADGDRPEPQQADEDLHELVCHVSLNNIITADEWTWESMHQPRDSTWPHSFTCYLYSNKVQFV